MSRPAIHISIEGFDGIGKTTICKLIAELLGYKFVEKPLHFLFDEGDSFDEYIRIRDKVNDCPDRDFTASFYGLGSLYLYHLYDGQNIVTDRHLCSNYAWSGTEGNEDIYDLLLKKLGKPDLTVVLDAEPETIRYRLTVRNLDDPDLKRVQKSEEVYRKMRKFCLEKGLNTLWIHTDDLLPSEIIAQILSRLDDLQKGAAEGFKETEIKGDD